MIHKLLFLLFFLSWITGCSLVPGYQRPASELPAAWQAAPAQSLPVGERWWTLYQDSALDALIAEAFAHNRDLALAAARVDEARALARVANAPMFPSLDATAQRDRTRSSEVAPIPIPANALERNSYRAQPNVAYDLDLWGRLRGAGTAARAELLATEAARDTVRLALGADVVRAYFNLRALDEQVAITQRTLALRDDNGT